MTLTSSDSHSLTRRPERVSIDWEFVPAMAVVSAERNRMPRPAGDYGIPLQARFHDPVFAVRHPWLAG